MTKIVYDGSEISIKHLAPMMIACPCDGMDRDLAVAVSFSNHCYTEGFDPTRHDNAQIIVRDGGGPRVFCPVRHGLSLRLPAIVDRFPDEKVYQTSSRRNYVFAVPLEIERQIYEVYFMLQRAETASMVDLRLTIESAYPVDAPTPRPKRPNAIRFKVLARKVLRRERIHFAPR